MNTLLGIVLPWLKDNVKHLGWPLAVVFCGLWLRGCGALADCQGKQSAPVTVTASQAATQTAKASVTVKLVYRDRLVEVPGEAPRPLPCPDVEIQADSGSEATHWQSQAVTIAPKTALDAPRNALFLGGGYLSGPVLAGGYRRDRLGIQVQGWTDRVGGLLTVDALVW